MVANILPMQKKDSKVRIRIDYKDLNKTSLKDDFPLPYINVLVNDMACHARFSFMAGFLGYSQIKMTAEDRENTSFSLHEANLATNLCHLV